MRTIKAVLSKAATVLAPQQKPAQARERTRGYFPDDDLEELEHPRTSGGWLDLPKDWLWGSRRR